MSSTSSIFSNVFSYRQREKNSPLENFLIEIFAFCLINDPRFQRSFLALFTNSSFADDGLTIVTQKHFEGYGRPDIEIRGKDVTIFIECKVESSERKGQLAKYLSLLRKDRARNRNFVYLTKYYEPKDFEKDVVNITQLRWIDVYKSINETNREITNELKTFLKENHMEDVKNFSMQDLNAMKSISAAISKMDEVLEQVKPEFERILGPLSKDSSRSSRLWDNHYASYSTMSFKRINYNIYVGFFWDDPDTEIPEVGISIALPVKLDKTLLSDCLDSLEKKKWIIYQYDSDFFYYTALKPITEFIDKDIDNIIAIKKFISEKIRDLGTIKDGRSKILCR